MDYDQTVAALAPSVEAQWREDFILEMRLQGPSGHVIADALAEVETHCRDSRQSALEAFGPAIDYARALDLPDESRWTPAQLVRTWITVVLLVVGVWVIPLGVSSLAQGERTEINAGMVVSFGVIIIMMALVFALGDRLLRAVLNHPVWSIVSFGLVVAAVPLAGLPLRGLTLGTVAAGPTLAVGIAAIVASGIIALLERLTGTGLDDPLVPPHGSSGLKTRS